MITQGAGRAFALCRLVVAILSTVSCSTAPPDAPPNVIQLRIGTGGRRGYSYRMAEAMAKTLSSRDASYSVEFETTDDVSSVRSIQQGKSDCGFTSANIAYEAFAGRLPDDPRRYDRLRGVALVQLTPLHFLVRKDSAVRDVSDLRGGTLAIGAPGTATSRIAMLVLRAYGLDRGSVRILDEGLNRAMPPLVAGTLDGVFLLYWQMQTSEEITRFTQEGVEALPLQGSAIERLRQEYPFIRPALILAGTYPKQKEPIRTIGVESLIICRADLQVERVQEITEAWFHTTNHLLQENVMFDAVSPELASATPIPLHEGATRYYRGRRLPQ